MSVAVLVPTTPELEAFVEALEQIGLTSTESKVGRIEGMSYLDGHVFVCQGRLGKVSFGIRSLHVVENMQGISGLICAGTCGALKPGLSIGDIIVAEETVEHDFNRKLIPGPQPRFAGDDAMLTAIRSVADTDDWGFSVEFGTVASGDEAIITTLRSLELQESTGAIAAAWEGAGGAKACEFAGVPYLEIRAASDLADEDAPVDFQENIPTAMLNLAKLLLKVKFTLSA